MRHWRNCLFFFLFLTILYHRPCFGEQSASEKKWSLSFNNASVSQVLDELTRVTGVDIYTNKIPENKTLTKSYKDQTVDEIVRDLFRGTSFALVWNDGESGAASLDIWVFDGNTANTPRTFSPIERQYPTNPNPPIRRSLLRPNPSEEDEDSEDVEEKPEREEPEGGEETSPPTEVNENPQDESPERAGKPPVRAPGVPQGEDSEKEEPE